MEQLNNTQTRLGAPEGTRESLKSQRSFIESNTIPMCLEEIKSRHVIPSFANGETLISHSDFVESMHVVVADYYAGESIEAPVIRLSHPIQGRIPESRHKPFQCCTEQDLTVYYDRMMFVIEVPTMANDVEGNLLSLTIGGVQAYNLNNLHNRKGADEHFKIFIGFKNTVCCNLKVWSDGLISDLRVTSLGQLKGTIRTLLENYNAVYHLASLRRLANYCLTESEFAHLVGRCRLYNHLPMGVKKSIHPVLLTDTQINLVVREFYNNPHFGKENSGSLNLWRLYNLLTEANKCSYIDTFLEKGVNSFQIVEHLKSALENRTNSWFLN